MRKRGRVEADELKQFVAATVSLITRLSFSFKNNANVTLHIEMRKQAGLLNDVTNSPAEIYGAYIVGCLSPRPIHGRR